MRGKTLTERELDKILNDVKECKQITDIGITAVSYTHLDVYKRQE